MLLFWDTALTIIHLAFTFFNLTGWIWKATRKAHIVTLGLTLLSWIVLGYWYGWGYCLLTDIQWDIKEKLGEKNLPASFIKYFADKIKGSNIPSIWIDRMTLTCFVIVILASVYVNVFIPKRKKTN